MGTVFQIPWTYLPKQPPEYVTYLQAKGFTAAAMALRSDTLAVDDPKLARCDKLAVILGTEGEGLKEQTILSCDYTIKIPMSHGVDSLNVAAASAVAFWELGVKDDR
jgi:tRNA G18 (ribose-2'-O)-methylase SpoU